MHDRVRRIEAHVVEVTPKTRWIFVEVATDAGLKGVGEASLNSRDGAVLAGLRALGPAVFALAHAAPAPLGRPRGLAEAAALSAVDQALWDIAARRAGTSVAQALGGVRRDAVALYANINRRTRDRRPEGFAASARAGHGRRFRGGEDRALRRGHPGRSPRRWRVGAGTRPHGGDTAGDRARPRADGRLPLAI